MGTPKKNLYLLNTGDETGNIILTADWHPIKHKPDDGKWYYPKECPLGLDMWIPNFIGLKPEDGIVKVKLEMSEEETGLWVICFDDYFGNETHIFACKPIHKPEEECRGYKGFSDWEFPDPDDWGLHVWIENCNMVAGDGPLPVTLKIIDKVK